MLNIEGVRLRLRDWKTADLPMFEHWSMPGHQWQKLDGPYYAKPTAEEVPQRVAKLQSRIDKNEWPEPRVIVAIADKQTDTLIGLVSRYWESKETNWLSVGIVIYDPAFWQQGLGFEALGLWSEHLFTKMPELVRLDLRTWSGNHGMMRLAEKHGYQQEACFRMARVVEGEYYDGLGYGILRSEWEALHPQGVLTTLQQQVEHG